MPNNPLRIIPLGGLGEIGKNMMALEDGNDIVIIDAGVQFPREDMPGVDLIIPDISYLISRRDKVRAILITHGHEDHIGALPYVLKELDVPVYASQLARGLITVKVKKHHSKKNHRIVQIEPGETYRFGKLSAEWFRVCHSIPDAMGIAIHTSQGTVIHTGDFKIDHTPVDGHTTDFKALSQYAANGVFLLLADSTYAEVPGYTPSETVVGEALDQAIANADGRVMVATFASLISRIQQVINASSRYGRKVAVVGRSMVDNVKMATSMGYLKIPAGTLLPYNEVRNLRNDQVTIIMTGSQGEPTSALVRVSNREHRDVKVEAGDTIIISASPIPGNETAVSRSTDNLFRQKAKVIDYRSAMVHVHGHASREELKMILNLVRPKYFVPVHGEYRHLVKHIDLAQEIGVPKSNTFLLEDGDVLELTNKKGRMQGQVTAGPIYIDGNQVWDMYSNVLKDRRALSRDGMIVAILAIDELTGHLIRKPKLVSSGFMENAASSDILTNASSLLMKSLDECLTTNDWNLLSNKVQEELGRYLLKQTGLRPMIMPIAVKV
jgi:ribonuclease J